MSHAIKCDVCGGYAEHRTSVTVNIRIPTSSSSAQDLASADWELEVCLDCLKHPLSLVIHEGCEDLEGSTEFEAAMKELP